MRVRALVILILSAAPLGMAAGDEPLRLKRPAEPDDSAYRSERRLKDGRRHVILEFSGVPGLREWRALAVRGVQPLGAIPDRGLIALVPDAADPWIEGVERVKSFAPSQKWSREMAGVEPQLALVEFHRDVEPWEARWIPLLEGLRPGEHPDLRADHLLVEGNGAALRRLAEWDEVAYIFPASRAIERGEPVHACAGALTAGGPVAQYIAAVGPGWDGYGQGAAHLTYSYQRLSQRLPAEVVTAEIERAMAEWSRHVWVTFLPGGYPASRRNVNLLFATGEYGSFYPFDGPGRILARTFYPSPPNPEPIAGDVHFDDDEPWNIGARIDVFSVALHELGHALGLAHSDNPNDVMYPYYKMAAELAPGDVAAIRALYLSTEPETPVEPLRLEIAAPADGAQTQAAWIRVSGSAGGGVAPLRIAWSSAAGFSGGAEGADEWLTPPILLRHGANLISVSVTDSRGATLSRHITVERLAESPPPPAEPEPEPQDPPEPPGEPRGPALGDKTAPILRILYPASTNVVTGNDAIELRGMAIDNSGVAKVTWSANTGESGTASGTGFWRSGPVRLMIGMNIITVHAYDPAGNDAWRSVMVTRR